MYLCKDDKGLLACVTEPVLTYHTQQPTLTTSALPLRCAHLALEQVGLWMLVQHVRDRNYLAANDVYLKLAIGNAPWPIGE